MTEVHAFFLGVLQGLTEFIPVSSDGHLVLAEHVLGLNLDSQTMQVVNVFLHSGTLLALLLVYGKRWFTLLLSISNGDRVNRKILYLLIISTIPAVVVGLLFQDVIAGYFSSLQALALCFLLTAFILWTGERFQYQKHAEHLSASNAFFIGVAQAFSLLPSLSRSGLTMSAGRAVGLSRQESLDFSFLMLLPVLAGASTLIAIKVVKEAIPLPNLSVLLVGFVSSFATSILALLFLRRFVRQYSLSWFSVYLVFLSGILFLSTF